MRETIATGEYPDYYLLRSRKYAKSWKVKEFPIELSYKGKVVYSFVDAFTVLDGEGNQIVSIEYVEEMRD